MAFAFHTRGFGHRKQEECSHILAIRRRKPTFLVSFAGKTPRGSETQSSFNFRGFLYKRT